MTTEARAEYMKTYQPKWREKNPYYHRQWIAANHPRKRKAPPDAYRCKNPPCERRLNVTVERTTATGHRLWYCSHLCRQQHEETVP